MGWVQDDLTVLEQESHQPRGTRPPPAGDEDRPKPRLRVDRDRRTGTDDGTDRRARAVLEQHANAELESVAQTQQPNARLEPRRLISLQVRKAGGDVRAGHSYGGGSNQSVIPGDLDGL